MSLPQILTPFSGAELTKKQTEYLQLLIIDNKSKYVSHFKQTKSTSIGSYHTLLGKPFVQYLLSVITEYCDILGCTLSNTGYEYIIKTLLTNTDYLLLSVLDIHLAMQKMCQAKHYGKPSASDIIRHIHEYQIDRTDYFENQSFEKALTYKNI